MAFLVFRREINEKRKCQYFNVNKKIKIITSSKRAVICDAFSNLLTHSKMCNEKMKLRQ